MENDSAFLPVSQTYVLAGAVSPPTAILLGTQSGAQISVKLYNSGTVLAGVSYAATAALASSQAVIPTAGNPQTVVIVGPGEDLTITTAPGQFWTAVTPSSTATVYAQTGNGL